MKQLNVEKERELHPEILEHQEEVKPQHWWKHLFPRLKKRKKVIHQSLTEDVEMNAAMTCLQCRATLLRSDDISVKMHIKLGKRKRETFLRQFCKESLVHIKIHAPIIG